jgi:hypothetical protein
MTRTLRPVAIKKDPHPTTWISIVFGLIALSGCPVPIVNNWMFNLACMSMLVGFVSLFVGMRSAWGLLGMTLSGLAILGTIYFQNKLKEEVDNIFNVPIPTQEAP